MAVDVTGALPSDGGVLQGRGRGPAPYLTSWLLNNGKDAVPPFEGHKVYSLWKEIVCTLYITYIIKHSGKTTAVKLPPSLTNLNTIEPLHGVFLYCCVCPSTSSWYPTFSVYCLLCVFSIALLHRLVLPVFEIYKSSSIQQAFSSLVFLFNSCLSGIYLRRWVQHAASVSTANTAL